MAQLSIAPNIAIFISLNPTMTLDIVNFSGFHTLGLGKIDLLLK